MERKPITIYLDNFHKQNNNLYQKKIILPRKYKANSNSFKKIKQNNYNGNHNINIKQSNNKQKINSYNIKEIKADEEPKDSIRKKDINIFKNKYSKNNKNINSIIFIQKIFRGFIKRKRLKNLKPKIFLINPLNQNKINVNNIFDKIKRNSKNQKEIIQLNNNRYNNRNTMSPKNNIKMNMIYKKNLILLKKEISKKKNYSFDYKNKDPTIKKDESINPYKSKNKNIITNLNKNKKNSNKNHFRINSCDNVNKDIDFNNNVESYQKNKIIINNKNNKNKNNKSFLSSNQTKENSNTNSNITSTNKSNIESPKINVINNDKLKSYQEKNKIKINSKDIKIKEENISENINKPLKSETFFDNYFKERADTEEKKAKNFHFVNNSNAKYNFNPMIKNQENKKIEKKKHSFTANFDMPKFCETKKNDFFESIKEEKINESEFENDADLKSSFYDDEEFVIINYDYTLNDKKRALKVSRVENFNFDGYLRRKMDFIKFIKHCIYSNAIKHVFNIIKNINKKKLQVDKTMTENESISFIQQEKIERNKINYNKVRLDINKNE